MSDPFKYLGISPNASKTEIDNAYNQMKAQCKYDNNSDSLSRDIAENKLREIEEAYQRALNQMALPKQENNFATPFSPNVNQGQSNQSDNFNGGNDKYILFENNYYIINSLINDKRFTDAEKVILEYNLEGYAKWHYVFARLRFSQGWMNEALEHYKKAYELEPNNQLYRQSYENICNMRDGKIKKHSKHAAMAIAIGVGACYCCCNLSPLFADTELCNSCGEAFESCFDETGCTSVCCDPCNAGCNAYSNTLCDECCGGCRNG